MNAHDESFTAENLHRTAVQANENEDIVGFNTCRKNIQDAAQKGKFTAKCSNLSSHYRQFFTDRGFNISGGYKVSWKDVKEMGSPL